MRGGRDRCRRQSALAGKSFGLANVGVEQAKWLLRRRVAAEGAPGARHRALSRAEHGTGKSGCRRGCDRKFTTDALAVGARFNRDFASGVPASLRWIFFEVDPAACKRNATARSRQSLSEELEKINVLSAVYTIPTDAETRPVWKPAGA